MDMEEVLKTLKYIALIFYHWFVAIVLFFVPARLRSKDVSGEKVLITGGGSGLGRLLAQDFARRGAHVVLWDINEHSMKETASAIQSEVSGAVVRCYKCDLSKKDEINATADKVKKEVGEIDILVNNAGIVTARKLLDAPDGMVEATMNINTNAHFWMIKKFLPSMLERDHGHVVTIASMAGICGMNGLCDYCASKFGAVGLDEALRSEIYALGKKGVHTTVVCPCYIDTGMFHGAGVKWDWLSPLLEPGYAAGRIMDAILTNQYIVMMSRSMYIISFFKTIMPAYSWLLLGDISGISSSMDNFQGRSKSA